MWSKFSGEQPCQSKTLLKERLWYRCLPMDFAKFLRTPLVAASEVNVQEISLSWNFNRSCIQVTKNNKQKQFWKNKTNHK